MLIEITPDVFYQYSAKENSWIRLNGYKSIKPATGVSSGLMTKEDFIKVNKILTAPPQTTLTSDKCNVVFDKGIIKLYSKDGSIQIEDFLDLYADGTTYREKWQIHENTWGFNFRVNLQHLVEEMKKRGNIIAQTMVGPKGLPGERGKPGVNKLDTGPIGPPGLPGTNAPFLGSLIHSDLSVKDKNKSVVAIDVECVSPNENYLVVYKGTIGTENFCASQVKVQDYNSSWVLASAPEVICEIELNKSECMPCKNLVYLDIEVITNTIKEHVQNMILQAKKDREKWVREWLKTMMQLFNDQKHALCCGLENCMSRKRNEAERKYIETQRIAAAAADFNLIISGKTDGEDVPESHHKVELDMDEHKNCETVGLQPTQVIPISPPT